MFIVTASEELPAKISEVVAVVAPGISVSRRVLQNPALSARLEAVLRGIVRAAAPGCRWHLAVRADVRAAACRPAVERRGTLPLPRRQVRRPRLRRPAGWSRRARSPASRRSGVGETVRGLGVRLRRDVRAGRLVGGVGAAGRGVRWDSSVSVERARAGRAVLPRPGLRANTRCARKPRPPQRPRARGSDPTEIARLGMTTRA